MQLHKTSDDRSVLRYVYYFLARLLAESGAQGVTPGGGIPTPNWDALADLNLAGGTVVTRAEVVPQIITALTADAALADPAGMQRILNLVTTCHGHPYKYVIYLVTEIYPSGMIVGFTWVCCLCSSSAAHCSS